MLRLPGIIRRQIAARKLPHVINKSLLFCFLLVACLSTICNVALPSFALASNLDGKFYLPENLLSGTATYVIAASDAAATEKAQADVVCDGKADQVEINAAITAGYKHIVLSSGTFIVGAAIVYASNLWLQGQGSGSVIKIAGDYSGITATGKTYVSLADLKVDGDNTNTDHNAIQFLSCTQLNIRNLSIVNSAAFSLMAQSCDYGIIDNIYCSSAAVAFNDGVHLHECSNMTVNNIRGSTGDDLFAIGARSVASSNITVTNIVGTSALAHLCRIWITTGASAGADISDIVVRNISGAAASGLLIINSHTNGTISRVSVNNITGVGTTNLIKVDTTAGGTISDMYLDGFSVDNSSGYGVFICGVTRGALTNGSILNCADHSLLLRADTAFKCDNINIKTAVASQTGVAVENANDLILTNITSDVTGNAFLFGKTASTKVKMTNCKAITAKGGIYHSVDLTDSIIANNDLSNARTKVSGGGLFTDVIIKNNVGYIDPYEVRTDSVTASSRTTPDGMRVSRE
jgi:polygalacturonase